MENVSSYIMFFFIIVEFPVNKEALLEKNPSDISSTCSTERIWMLIFSRPLLCLFLGRGWRFCLHTLLSLLLYSHVHLSHTYA